VEIAEDTPSVAAGYYQAYNNLPKDAPVTRQGDLADYNLALVDFVIA